MAEEGFAALSLVSEDVFGPAEDGGGYKQAAIQGDTATIRRLVKTDFDLLRRYTPQRLTALQLAISHRHEQTALLLMKHMTRLYQRPFDVRDPAGRTVLHDAAEAGLERCVRVLIHLKVTPLVLDHNLQLPLCGAHSQGHINICDILVGNIDSKALFDVQIPTLSSGDLSRKCGLVHAVCLSGKLGVLRYLEGKNYDLNLLNATERTCLHYAMFDGRAGINKLIQYLLQRINGATLVNNRPTYPLLYLLRTRDQAMYRCLRTLEKKGLTMNHRIPEGLTVFQTYFIKCMNRIRDNKTDELDTVFHHCVAIMEKFNVTLNETYTDKKGKPGENLLNLSLCKYEYRLVFYRLLRRYNYDVNYTGIQKFRNPLQTALEDKDAERCEVLLGAGVSLRGWECGEYNGDLGTLARLALRASRRPTTLQEQARFVIRLSLGHCDVPEKAERLPLPGTLRDFVAKWRYIDTGVVIREPPVHRTVTEWL